MVCLDRRHSGAPHGQQLLSLDELGQGATVRRAVTGLQRERAGQRPVQVDAAELGFGQIDDMIAMWIEVAREVTQRGSLADVGFGLSVRSAGVLGEYGMFASDSM